MKRKDIMVIIVPMFIFVIIWISSSIYHSYVNSTIPETVTIQINPITPNFDTKIIEKLKAREAVVVPEEGAPKPTGTASSSSQLKTVSPTPTISGTISQASSGGNLNQ